MKEIWKDIPGYERIYQVSDQERVKSFRYGKERILKQNTNSRGYLCVCLYLNNKKTYRVHQLVAMAFLGHKPGEDGLDVDHDNHIKTDNRLSNLILRTRRENCSKDQWRKNPSSKYVGVSMRKDRNKWRSEIRVNGKKKHLGYFTSELEAHKAYQKALKEINKNPSQL